MKIVKRIIGVLFIAVLSHGHDSTPTAEIFIVLGGNDTSFFLVFIVHTLSSDISLFSSATAWSWTFDKNQIHLKSLLVVKGFVAVQLTS